ncbi:UHRF1-binding protein 1-like isoform X2 [Acanthaster planci]|uniref:UHRF1-binding protein 1-like isoform X2 n=1 Tax=Acanthaster planci TaxID=133434 RepID=A0A8B7XS67_ACAPL|nr:UHRF1-binding protein 1-like isoform X2 [Acanthaster planci]
MASIIKGQIIKHLSKFAKDLSQDRIRLSTLKGEGNLTDLELDEDALMEVLEFPSWLVLNRAVCNKVSVKIPWTKLKTHPICIYLDQVELEMATCRTLRETAVPLEDTTKQSQVPVSRYGFAEKVVDGMYIHINSITGTLKSDTFHINLQIAQLIVQSTTPNWRSADLRYTRIKDSNREQILTFKEVEWSTVRLTLDAIETDRERPTTPIRLITNQGKVRVTIKKREADCSLVTSKLQMLLDDILWVLTDSQMKAVILHIRSLMPVIQKAANLSKARAADKGQPTATPAHPVHEDPAGRAGHNVKTQKELQMLQYFEKYDVQETSYHLFTRSVDLHLCDEMNQPEQETFKRRVENGAMQIGLHGFSLDYYPFHTASSSREHWEFYDDAMRTSDKWIHTLLAHLKQQYKYAADYITKQSGGKGQHKVGGQISNKGNKSPPPRPATGPNMKVKSQGKEQVKGHPETRGQPPSSSRAQQQSQVTSKNPLPQARGGQPPPGGTGGRSRSSSSSSSRVKLMSHSMVVRVRDFRFHSVAVGRSVGQHAKSKTFLLQSDKKTFFLPSEMPSLHIEYTSFYFPDELSFPVPSPVVYVQLNPVQFRLDYTSILWLNQFSFNILQTLPDVDEYGQGVVSEGRDHTDVRIDALMPKVILPAEEPVLDQPDRPPELHIQMSQVTATNCRVGTGSTRPDLSHILQALNTRKLFVGSESFPSAAGDFKTLPRLFWDHAYQANFILPPECEAELPVANGDLPNRPGDQLKPDQPVRSGVARLTTHVFRPDAVDDVWNVKIEQVWADFHGVLSSPDRPVPLVDPIPLSLWLCWPNKRGSQSRDRTNPRPTHGSQSGDRKHSSEFLSPCDGTDSTISSDQSLSKTATHRALGRLSANPNLDKETEQLRASLAKDSQSPQLYSHGAHVGDKSTTNASVCGTSAHSTLSSSAKPVPEGAPAASGVGLAPCPSHKASTEATTADVHVIAQTSSKVSLVINHYQLLFLLRLQQSVQKLQQSLEADQQMFAAKDKPVPPPLSQMVAFECPDIEATVVMPPIPGDEEEAEVEEGELPNGRTGASLDTDAETANGIGASTGDSDSPQGDKVNPVQDFHSEGKSVALSESDKGSPDSDVPTVEISGSSPVKEHRGASFGSADGKVALSQHDTAGPVNGGPPGAIVISDGAPTRTSSLTHSRQPSDGSTGSSQSQRRRSQEVLLTSHSASGSPIFRNADSIQPPRSSSQSDLARVHHAQFSFSSLQQVESGGSRAESQTSLDESVDLDIISLSSDSSEGLVLAIKGDGQSVSSGQGTETESDAGQEQSKAGGEIFEEAPEDFRDNKFKLKKVSVVSFHLIGVTAALEINGSDLAVKAHVNKLEREEKGNADFKEFMSTVAAGERSKKSKLEEDPDLPVKMPVALLRFQSGPKAEVLSPGGGERGFLQLEVCGLATTFRMSTMTHLGSFMTDEIISDAMPMSIRVSNSVIELMDDTPPIYPSHPGPQPMCLGLSGLHVRRTGDGIFRIEGTSEVPQAPSVPVPQEDKTPTASPAQLEDENARLVGQVLQMKAALDVLEIERSSLLATLEHLQEELLTVDRERDVLRNSVVELSRLLNLQR